MEIADKIAEDLFTSGFGTKASRLVLMSDGSYGPGWSKQAVIKIIEGHLQPAVEADYCQCSFRKTPEAAVSCKCLECGKSIRIAYN